MTEVQAEQAQPQKLQITTPMIPVHPRGPEDSAFCIVGEAPGKQEIKARQPFVGPSGFILNTALAMSDHVEPYITNVVPHMITEAKDNTLLIKYAAEHKERVLAEVRKHPRKVILALGNVAVWALTGNTSHKITQIRGKRIESDLAEFGIIPSVHPAYLLRGNGSFRQFKADVSYAALLSNGGLPHEFIPPTWEYVDTPEKAGLLLQKIRDHKGYIAGDIETGGFSHRTDKILMGGFTLDGRHVYVIPGWKREYIAKGIPDITPLMGKMWDKSFAPDVRYVWHNGKFDIKFYQHQYNQDAQLDEDTMLMSYALDETRGVHDLEQVASDWIGSPDWKAILDSHKRSGDSYDVIPEPVLVKYMAYDIANTYNLANILRPLVARDIKSNLLYEKTLIPGSRYLACIETNGMLVDTQRVAENAEDYQQRANIFDAELQEIAKNAGLEPYPQVTTSAGKKIKKVMSINVNSPVQLSSFLFETLKIPTKDKSTNEKVLDSLPSHPAVIALRNYRKINKGLTTYVTPVADHIQDDGRVHQSYLIHGTATGRLACRDPNLQNIPREPRLRGQFIPREGYCFVECDLNQAELRSLACLSGDDELCRIYTDPKSKGLHNEVRADLYGNASDWNDVTIERYKQKWYISETENAKIIERILEEQKMRAKNVNFGIVYGITPFGLAEQIEDSTQEAARMLAGWAKKFPQAWQFIESCRSAPIHGKNIVTVFGHKKRFGVVSPENITATMNEAANFPHQSTASTITLHGGMEVEEYLRKECNVYIVNTVHDSVLMEVPMVKDVIEHAAKIMIDSLESIAPKWGITRIPFKAEAKAGTRWGSLKDLEKFLDANFDS